MENYFDYNSTCCTRQEVIDVVSRYSSMLGNPSSVHTYGGKKRDLIEDVRDFIGDFLHIDPERVIFTSGATESNNLALSGFAGKVICSAIEHNSIYKPVAHFAKLHQLDLEDVLIPVDSQGLIDQEALEYMLKRNKSTPVLVCIMAANNETGAVQPVEKLADIIHKYPNKYIFCDAVQCFTKFQLDWNKIDMGSFSGHKLSGPAGVGGLIISDRTEIEPLFLGGSQEFGLRPGTENFTGIMGMQKAVELCCKDDLGKVARFRDQIENDIKQFCPQATTFSNKVERICNTAMIGMPGVDNDLQIEEFDRLGISVSSGSACTAKEKTISRVLTSMGFSHEVAKSAIRISLGFANTELSVKYFVDSWKTIYNKHRGK